MELRVLFHTICLLCEIVAFSSDDPLNVLDVLRHQATPAAQHDPLDDVCPMECSCISSAVGNWSLHVTNCSHAGLTRVPHDVAAATNIL